MGCFLLFGFLAVVQLHIAKLLVGNTQNAHIAPWGQMRLDAFDVHLGIFAAGAVAYVYGELEHDKAILEHFLSKRGIDLPVLFGFGWQVE